MSAIVNDIKQGSRAKDTELRGRASRVIPNGMYGHLSVQRLPDTVPQFYAKASGCRLWDVDGNEYIDYMCAYGPMILGYNDPVIEEAAKKQRATGLDCSTGPSAHMVELAELMVEITPSADWAMFAKNGDDVTRLAVTVSRATTNRKHILRMPGAYHGASPVWMKGAPGVIPEDHLFQVPYSWNDLESVRRAALEGEAKGDVAAILVSSFDYRINQDLSLPEASFAKGVRDLCDEIGAMLIVDDVRTCFRVDMGGSWWGWFGIKADLLCYSKSLANNYPLSALLGNDKCRKGASVVFATGSFWYNAVPHAASITTIQELKRRDAIGKMQRAGKMLGEGLVAQGKACGLPVNVTGPPAMPFMTFQNDDVAKRPRAVMFCQECARLGVLLHPRHNWFLSAAHTDDDIAATLRVTAQAMETVKAAFPENVTAPARL